MVPLASGLLGFDLRHFFPVKGETELSDDATSPCALAAESAAGGVCHPLDCACVGGFLARAVLSLLVSAWVSGAPGSSAEMGSLLEGTC